MADVDEDFDDYGEEEEEDVVVSVPLLYAMHSVVVSSINTIKPWI